MIFNFNGRSAALLFVALFLATFTTASGQTALPSAIAAGRFTAGKAGLLRSHLADQLKGKFDNAAIGEQYGITGGGRSISCELVSQTVTIGREKVEQVSVIYKESGVTRTLDFVQYANGDLGMLEGNKLVTYSLASNRQACLDDLFGPGSACAACRTKVNSCLSGSNRLYKIYACLLRNIDGSCLNCGVDYYLVLGCILG